MHLIVITGPSASGKSHLAKRISHDVSHITIIKTDSYYRDNLIIKLLSRHFKGIYDRIISINKKELVETLTSILNREEFIYNYSYDFKTKKSTKREIIRSAKQYENNIIILEGIFAHRVIETFKNQIFMKIFCSEDKDICFRRRIERDSIERGRKRKEVEERFDKSWEIFHNRSYNLKKDNQIIYLKEKDEEQYNKIINIIKSLNLNAKKNVE